MLRKTLNTLLTTFQKKIHGYIEKTRNPNKWNVDMLENETKESTLSSFQRHFRLWEAFERMKDNNTSALKKFAKMASFCAVGMITLCTYLI